MQALNRTLFAFLWLLPFLSQANLHLAPDPLNLSRAQKGIYVDFTTAHYKVHYDFSVRQAIVEAAIEFEANETGFPIVDTSAKILSASLNNAQVELADHFISEAGTRVKIIQREVSKGRHTLSVKSVLKKNLIWDLRNKAVKSAFWMSDLTDRAYLERYMVTNLEFDQYPMSFDISITGTDTLHEVFANGELTKIQNNHFRIKFPEYFTASSVFFHLTKEDAFPKLETKFLSMNGKEIPILIYGNNNLQSYKTETLKVLAELERDYGPWPHAQLVIYGAGSGGMEYCGATMTSLWALGHELIHSYFARGVMPARGNAGWIDEAIASWRDDGYPQKSRWKIRKTQMAGHSQYQRTTDRDAYSKGAVLMGHLDLLTKDSGGLKAFLRELFTQKKHQLILTKDFLQDLNDHFPNNFDKLFDKYVYGKKGIDKIDTPVENPYHPILTEQQMLDLL